MLGEPGGELSGEPNVAPPNASPQGAPRGRKGLCFCENCTGTTAGSAANHTGWCSVVMAALSNGIFQTNSCTN